MTTFTHRVVSEGVGAERVGSRGPVDRDDGGWAEQGGPHSGRHRHRERITVPSVGRYLRGRTQPVSRGVTDLTSDPPAGTGGVRPRWPSLSDLQGLYDGWGTTTGGKRQ